MVGFKRQKMVTAHHQVATGSLGSFRRSRSTENFSEAREDPGFNEKDRSSRHNYSIIGRDRRKDLSLPYVPPKYEQLQKMYRKKASAAVWYSAFFLLILAAGCGPEVRKIYPPRYMKKASKEAVFNESIQAVYMMARGINNSTDKKEGYIRSVPYPPPPQYRSHYRVPTRYVLEVSVDMQKEGENVFYAPEFTLSAVHSKDWGKTWSRISPPKKYRKFLEEYLEKRVVTILSGKIERVLKSNQYIGFIITRDKVPVFASPARKKVIAQAMKYHFGELQFGPTYTKATRYENDMLYVNLTTPGRKKVLGWVHDDTVRIFIFELEGTPGTVETFKQMYKKEFIKGVSREIGKMKCDEENWGDEIRDAIINKKILNGMTEEQVVAVMGPPQETKRVETEDSGEVLVYTYRDLVGRMQKRVHFINGRVFKFASD